MINNLPKGWKIEELGNCVDILDKQRIPLNNQEREERIKDKNISELYPYYGATQQTGYIDDFIFDEELVLLGEDGVLFYDRDKPKAYLINGKSWVNNHAHVLRAKKNITINKYLLNFLNTFHYKGFVSGATRLKLNQSRMAKIPIPIAPLKQQEKIVKVLDLTSNLIEKQKELLEKYDLFLKSKFIEMFGDPIKNPMGWEECEIRDLVSQVNYGTSQKANENVQGIPILRMNNITYSGYLDITKLKHIELNEKDRTKYILSKGDLLFNRTNSKELVGKTTVFNLDEEYSFAGYLVRSKTNEKANSYFISFFMNSDYGKAVLLNKAKSIVGMANINAQEMQNIKCYIPPIELQNKFASIVKKIETIKEKENKKLKQLEDLHNSLMQKAFKGEIG